MYAIVEVAGKQYKVTKGITLYVDKLNEEAKKKIELDKVLLVKSEEDVKIGVPYVEGAVVKASVIDPKMKDKKIIVFKYKNKTGYHKKQGHRQRYTALNIDDIVIGEKVKKVVEEKAATPKKSEIIKEVKTTKEVTKPTQAKTAKKDTTAAKPAAEKKTTASKSKKEDK